MTQELKKVMVAKVKLQTRLVAVADGRVKPLPIIDRFDEMPDRAKDLGERSESSGKSLRT